MMPCFSIQERLTGGIWYTWSLYQVQTITLTVCIAPCKIRGTNQLCRLHDCSCMLK